jgi:ATP synthase protein I
MPGPQRNNAWTGMGIGWSITSTLLAGMLAVGAIGYAIDRLVGTQHVFTAIGFIVGAAGGIYIVYLKYGRGDGDDQGA